jgi:hypothetical protein
MAILPVPEFMDTPLNEIPKDMAAFAVFAFCPRTEIFPPFDVNLNNPMYHYNIVGTAL